MKNGSKFEFGRVGSANCGSSPGAKSTTAAHHTTRTAAAKAKTPAKAAATPNPKSTYANGKTKTPVAGLNGNPAGPHQQLRDILRAEIKSDGTLGDWIAVGRLDSAYATHAAFVHDGWLYVVGGVENNARFVSTVQRAPIRDDGRVGFFEPAEPLPVGRGHVHQTPVWRDFVYSVGGSASRRLMRPMHIGRLTKNNE